MKTIFNRSVLVLFAFLLSFNSALASDDEESLEGKTLYSTINLWYERPTKLLPLFHAGVILPVGTKVTFGDMNRKAFKFKTEDGTQFRVYSRKYYKLTGPEMIKLMFSSKNPMEKGGKFHKFSKMEQKQIKLGQLKKGMSRKAAIMAYGYPPTHANPNLEADNWQLWKSRWKKMAVTFENDKISNIRQ